MTRRAIGRMCLRSAGLVKVQGGLVVGLSAGSVCVSAAGSFQNGCSCSNRHDDFLLRILCSVQSFESVRIFNTIPHFCIF